MTGSEVVKRLTLTGWFVVRIRGSHHLMRKGDKRTIVPVHAKRDLPPGTLAAIRRQTGEEL
jgi:predicted RNA binding protein YcfA (HicA-like mRNA interferase family)